MDRRSGGGYYNGPLFEDAPPRTRPYRLGPVINLGRGKLNSESPTFGGVRYMAWQNFKTESGRPDKAAVALSVERLSRYPAFHEVGQASKVVKGPKSVGESGLDRGRRFDGRMLAAEVVVHEVDRERAL